MSGPPKRTRTQLLMFLLVGLGNTAIGLSVILGLMWIFGLHPVLANVAGYAAGLCFSFFANGRWTFGQRATGARAVRFMLAFAASYLVNLGMLMGLIEGTGLPPALAQICAMASYTGVFFLLSRSYVFAKAPVPDAVK